MKPYVETKYGKLAIEVKIYATNNVPAVVLTDYESPRFPVCTLSVNLSDHTHELEEGEFFVKTLSENEYVVKKCLESGWFEDTGKRVPTGHVQASVWKFSQKYIDMLDVNAPKNTLTNN